ncbi:NDP-sugar synthase [Aquihabitans sp. G128]|uniref:sugar phosphate nucleotidyltransferase n=1 Tax=Aquihabitans sp. G128 TaxID=2849779 RepID=UPI001C246541|nr:NDP-sugar synthase [Aquihabitans sp. G128]QXC61436.1 NDP-sugar synthase [Aquihabitans sp. G128]
MKAVVLVGGFGTRLRPLTLTTPKQMLPILHKPMIEHVLEHLASHGINEAVLSMGYRPDAFADAYPEGLCAGVKLHYAIEPEPLDTAGAIRFAARHAGIADRFVVVNGDVLTDLDIGALVRFHDEHHGEGTIALHKVDDPSAFGVVPTEADGKVIAFVEKPPRDEAPTDLINAGTYVLEASVLDRIADGRKVSIEREVFPAMVADGVLYATPGDTYWIDTGTPPKYLQSQMDLLRGVRGERAQGIHPSATIAPDAVVARSVIGEGVEIGAGAAVRGSIVMPGAKVGAGAVVERAILGRRSVVGAGARVDDLAVLGDDAVVGPDLRVSGGSVGVGEHLELSPSDTTEGA